MKKGEKELELLARTIVNKLEEEFAMKHMSLNLVKTIRVEKLSDQIKIYIPAQTYNMLLFQTKGVVVHTSHGSYASKLDQEGSKFYSYKNGTRKGSKLIARGNHKGYIDKVIRQAVEEWSSLVGRNKIKRVEF